MIKVIKKKNPNYKEHIDNHFVSLLSDAIIYNDLQKFSEALNYKIAGKKCKDCKKIIKNCKCDKCVDDDDNPSFSDCQQNYCICGFINKNKNINNDIRLIILKVAIQNLNHDQLFHIKNKIETYLKLIDEKGGISSWEYSSLEDIVEKLNKIV